MTFTIEEAQKKHLDECDGERQLFELQYFDAVTKLQAAIDNAEEAQQQYMWQQQAATASNNQRNVPQSRELLQLVKKTIPKLPDLKLPEFDGDYSKWLFFKNNFESTIRKDDQLSDARKLQYLVGVCTGEALKIVEGFSLLDDSFENAWKLLLDTYDNEIIIIETHLEQLFKFPDISKNNKVESIRQLHWHLQTHVISLKSMKQPVQHWDTIIIHHAKRKLDMTEQKDWQDRHKQSTPENMPSLDDFLKFLIERSQSYMMLQQTKTKPANTWK